jgi:hypothetical protein
VNTAPGSCFGGGKLSRVLNVICSHRSIDGWDTSKSFGVSLDHDNDGTLFDRRWASAPRKTAKRSISNCLFIPVPAITMASSEPLQMTSSSLRAKKLQNVERADQPAGGKSLK